MIRYPDWPARLLEALAAAEERAFEFGSHDCALFAAGVVKAMTGVDVLATAGMAWTDWAGAEAVLARHGGLYAATATALALCGAEEIAPPFAQRGDVVALRNERGDTLGICVGATVAAPKRPQGIGFVPLTLGVRAWRV